MCYSEQIPNNIDSCKQYLLQICSFEGELLNRPCHSIAIV